MSLMEILELAIVFAASRADSKARQHLAEILNDLNQVLDPAAIAAPGVCARQLMAALSKHASAARTDAMSAYICAGETLKEMKDQLAAQPDQPLVYEFQVGRQNEDYNEEGARQPEHIIVEEKVTGRTATLLGVLRASGAVVEWLPRENGFKASFRIKTN